MWRTFNVTCIHCDMTQCDVHSMWRIFNVTYIQFDVHEIWRTCNVTCIQFSIKLPTIFQCTAPNPKHQQWGSRTGTASTRSPSLFLSFESQCRQRAALYKHLTFAQKLTGYAPHLVQRALVMGACSQEAEGRAGKIFHSRRSCQHTPPLLVQRAVRMCCMNSRFIRNTTNMLISSVSRSVCP